MNATGADAVLFHQMESVSQITLNRPSSLNAIDEEMAIAIQRCLVLAHSDPNCRCLVITGAGRAFCTGQALPRAGDANPLPVDIAGLIRARYVPIIAQIRDLPFPVVAAVNGAAVGAGLSLALAADIRVIADTAWFSVGFSQIGLVPDSGASYFLTRYLGYPAALQVSLTGQRILASDAQRLRLVSEVFPADSFTRDTAQFALHLASGPTRAFDLTKRLLSLAITSSLDQQMELEATFQQEASETADFAEGLSAFQQKREPHFQGR
jgi:2-(1,2-epoxy-1,2-dihydrophenyl)acetyl-CoA isomerase